jgi:oligopeptide transport system substrate-binding protein
MLRTFREKALIVLVGFLFALLPSLANAQMVYNRGNSGEPSTLDPHKMSTVQESHIGRDLFEGLLQYDVHGHAIPGAAESWTVSPDGKVYTFKIRENAAWSNGDPLVADDFVFAFRRMVDPRSASRYASILYPIQGAEEVHTAPVDETTAKKQNKAFVPIDELLSKLGARVIDKKTLEVTLRAPTPYFTEMLTHQAAFPLHKPSIDKYGTEWVKPGNLVSNGAYIVTEFVPKDHITLVKNKNYYDANKVKIDQVNYIPIEDRNSALKRFEAGEIDNYDQFPPEQMTHIRNDLKGLYFMGPYLGIYYYAIRTDKPPFNNPKLRRALSLAVDREYLAEKIFNGTYTPAYSLAPPGINGYQPAFADYKNMSQIDRDDEARKIMQDLGYSKDKPLKLEIRYNTGEEHKACAIAIADMYKNIFVETTMINTDGKTHYSYLQEKGDYDLARAGWIADFKDPQTFLAVVQTGDGNNYSQFSNAELDGWLHKAETEVDGAKRFEDLTKAEEVAMRETPVIVLQYYNYHNLVAKKLIGFEQNIMDVHPTKWMSIDNSRS